MTDGIKCGLCGTAIPTGHPRPWGFHNEDCPSYTPPTDPQPAHIWIQREGATWPECEHGDAIQRRDGQNPPCRGPGRISLRSEPADKSAAAAVTPQSVISGLTRGSGAGGGR